MILLQYKSVRGHEYIMASRVLVDQVWHQHEHADEDFDAALDYYQGMDKDWSETRMVYQNDNDPKDRVVLYENHDLPIVPETWFESVSKKFWLRMIPTFVLVGIGLCYMALFAL